MRTHLFLAREPRKADFESGSDADLTNTARVQGPQDHRLLGGVAKSS